MYVCLPGCPCMRRVLLVFNEVSKRVAPLNSPAQPFKPCGPTQGCMKGVRMSSKHPAGPHMCSFIALGLPALSLQAMWSHSMLTNASCHPSVVRQSRWAVVVFLLGRWGAAGPLGRNAAHTKTLAGKPDHVDLPDQNLERPPPINSWGPASQPASRASNYEPQALI